MSGRAERDLVSNARAGDRSAFDELVGPLVDQAFRLAFGMLHDREARLRMPCKRRLCGHGESWAI
jgi:hypothetical protein